MFTMQRARAILNVRKKNPDGVTNKAEDMCTGIENHPGLFANPAVATSAIRAQVKVVNDAKALARTKAHGTARARNVQVGILIGMMETELTYIQGCADKCSTPEEAASTIEAAGLTVARVGKHTKPILAVTKGPTPGSVNLDANATALGAGGKKKTFFNWQSTVDGKVFVSLPSTPKCRTSAAGFTPLNEVGFRVSVTNSDGIAGEWSQIVTFLIR
jgi:hypothetical protein